MSMINKTDAHRHLAWFLGPKAENAGLLEDFIVQVLRDYAHWRKNYFPGDPILIGKRLKSQLEPEFDAIDTRLNELMAQLRRNFPFYSPRYIAHELSDTLLSATVGYFAGTLFNPNNVTPEAAPVTTELEIEVCSAILTMLGYTAPPKLPEPNENPNEYYVQKSKEEFGWAHLTSGGTIANIEALWVARQVRYFPLSVKHAAARRNLDLTVKLPGATESTPIKDVEDYSLLLLKPNESIYLLSRYLDALRRKEDLQADINLFKEGWRELNKSEYSLNNGFAAAFSKFQPVILVAGSRHYSISKAANVLGIGQANIMRVDTDEYFRINIAHLESCLLRLQRERKVPLCVIASAGTTEEGAVDPLHQIVDLRAKLERERNLSFWLHVDAAWGGYIRSLFCMQPIDEVESAAGKISHILSIDPPLMSLKEENAHLLDWHDTFSARIKEIARSSKKRPRQTSEEIQSGTAPDNSAPSLFSETYRVDLAMDAGAESEIRESEAVEALDEEFANHTDVFLAKMQELLLSEHYEKYLQSLVSLPHRFDNRITEPELGSFKPGITAKNNWISNFASTRITIGKNLLINYPDREVLSAFMTFPKADSITVDPHKMGYAPYPAGCVAFKNDRIRSFILQHAPYITAAKHDGLIHVPPRHTTPSDQPGQQRRDVTESFSPFMLEGSRPGAVAAGLWLAMQTSPLIPKRHGLIVRASVLSARTLYEWLTRWNDWCATIRKDTDYDFIALTPRPPDTNLVTFVVKPKTRTSLSQTNALTSKVYETFTIQAELGEREYSYSQPFFLSNTRMGHEDYPSATLESFFSRCKFNKNVFEDYMKEGLVVLRATVMNPYILAAHELVEQDFIQLFVEELDKAASAAF